MDEDLRAELGVVAETDEVDGTIGTMLGERDEDEGLDTEEEGSAGR